MSLFTVCSLSLPQSPFSGQNFYFQGTLKAHLSTDMVKMLDIIVLLNPLILFSSTTNLLQVRGQSISPA